MPLYEYFCADCKGRFEVLTSYEAAQSGAMVCATCHGANVRRLLSVVAKRTHGASDDFGDFSDASYGDSCDMDGGCCGGACGGHN